jgi:DNA-binding NarL/FixJ family response regulator
LLAGTPREAFLPFFQFGQASWGKGGSDGTRTCLFPIEVRDPTRRTRAGKPDGSRLESLTERERQVGRLVVDRTTNAEIAAELFLSQKTVETHMRNIFRKMNVSSRVALARAIERTDRAAHASSP